MPCSLHRTGSVAILLTLQGIPLCRICSLQPSRGSEQVFLPRCQPSRNPWLLCREGEISDAWLGKAHGHCPREQGGLGETKKGGWQQQQQSWAPGQLRVGHMLRNRNLWPPLWARSHWGEQRSWRRNWIVADPQLDTSHHLPLSCVPEAEVCWEKPAWPSPEVGTAWLILGSPVRKCRHTGKGLQTSW